MSYLKVEFYRGNIEGRGEALEYYGAAAQIATRPVIITMMIIMAMIRNNKDNDDYDYEPPKVLSTRPHTQKLQYYGAAKTPYSSKLDTLPTGQVRPYHDHDDIRPFAADDDCIAIHARSRTH